MVRRLRREFIEPSSTDAAIDAVRSKAVILHDAGDLDPLMARIGDARYVLLGEASHGTAEFYQWRRLITERLVREKRFSFIAVEGDWPDCYSVNRFIKGLSQSRTARQVLYNFERWPTWMWANEEVVELAKWLREFNHRLPAERKVGFYGLDVYSLWDSMHAVLEYLEQADGAAAASARRAFECFEPFGYDVEDYARALRWSSESCEDEIVVMLRDLRSQSPADLAEDEEAHFNAEQNALTVKNAEEYYRTLVRGDAPSWNVRDRHMGETLDRLMARHGSNPKAIVWAHNTHIGDARYTDMEANGMFNIGQLVRQQHANEGVVLVGFSSHRGSVVAAEAWGAPMRKMTVPAAREGSWDDILHRAADGDRLIVFDTDRPAAPLLQARGQRAIGVVYRPQYEMFGNYVPTVMARRYDALIFLDETQALHPLKVPPKFEHEIPETFPTGV
jgi:erythromycin esterase-like protein